MKLKMIINKIKSIEKLEIELPIQKGLYAITGQNGSGKSTVSTCASSVFFNMQMNDYFGKTENDSSIEFSLGNAQRSYKKSFINNKWKWERITSGDLKIKGFYEGSLIYGNRFRNTNYNTLKKLEFINESLLVESSEFIRENLGYILHNDKHFYEKLFKVSGSSLRQYVNINGDIFYYQKGHKKISQFHMSTGENLLISILNSLSIRNSDRTTLNIPCLLILDEIELALHPSSLKRLVIFLKEISSTYNYAIYFSTHSIELISAIRPDNIFFLDRHVDNSLELINPCYPAYATKILFDQSGYDYVILVEDDLAREIIFRLLRKYSLLGNKLVHVLPCGGYANVIDLAQDVVLSNLMGGNTKILIVLDADIKSDAEKFIAKNNIQNNIPLNYLPVESLEKYLRTNLFISVNQALYRKLNDYVFQQVSLRDIIEDYKNANEHNNDNNGKKLYERLDKELRARNKNRFDLVGIIVDFLIDNNQEQITKIVNFLRTQLNN
ncbi:MAG: AAA family ATPase [Bacteroidetes bacterium]|nr:AAA family ATPase [Bacteroidota bacterium]